MTSFEDMEDLLTMGEGPEREEKEAKCVRKVFERDLLPGLETEELDGLFRKSGQKLIHRGLVHDPRNTDNAWIETSAFHIHCATSHHAVAFDDSEEQTGNSVRRAWLDVQVIDGGIKLKLGTKAIDLWVGHSMLLEMAIVGAFRGSADLPLVYDGKSREGEANLPFPCQFDANHSHYICVDDGTEKGAAFGCEVAIRADLETFISFYDYERRGQYGSIGVPGSPGYREPDFDGLTRYFERCVDNSTIRVNGRAVLPGQPSEHIPLTEDLSVIKVEQTRQSDVIAYNIRLIHSEELPEEDAERTKSDECRKVEGAGESSTQKLSSDLVALDFSAHTLNPRFQSDVHEYTLHVPPKSPDKVLSITPRLRENKEPILRAVPIVVLCYGGGPMTMKTLVAAGEKPLIIVRGSGRAAQFVDDWVRFNEQVKVARTSQGGTQVEVEILLQRQRQVAEASIRRDVAGANKADYDIVAASTEKPAWWDVSEFIRCLQTLGLHEQLNFFDILHISEEKDSDMKSKMNPMLPILTRSIFDSVTIRSSVKLPLAIRLNDKQMVRRILGQNIAIDRQDPTELVGNSRLLIYAAYHDLGAIVESMLEFGFDIEMLDHLIKIEVERELKCNNDGYLEKPPEWYCPRGSDERERDLLWSKMDLSQKKSVYRRITWNMLLDLSGVQFDVVDPNKDGTADVCEGRYVQRSVTVTDNICRRKLESAESKKIIEVQQKEYAGINGLVEGKHAVQMGDAQFEECSSHVKLKLAPLVSAGADHAADQILFFVCLFVVVVVLKKKKSLSYAVQLVDEITVRLPMCEKCECKFKLRKGRRSKARRMFELWLSKEGQDDEPLGDGKTDTFGLTADSALHPLHRLYWAINSNRPRLAKALMYQSPSPIVAALFAAYLYKDMSDKTHKVLKEK
eukprot:SAG11_NODE_2155_length_3735_cov_2.677668_2_plen_907_part_00